MCIYFDIILDMNNDSNNYYCTIDSEGSSVLTNTNLPEGEHPGRRYPSRPRPHPPPPVRLRRFFSPPSQQVRFLRSNPRE